MRKILNKKGESLLETLAAILIFTMASLILYSMVTTASKINIAARENDKAISEQLAVVEMKKTVADPNGNVKMTMEVTTAGSTSTVPIADFTVEVYGNGNNGELYSYSRKP